MSLLGGGGEEGEDCDLQFPAGTETPGWRHNSQGSQPPS